jgi:soluble lytic murein transglycosylase-like protein
VEQNVTRPSVIRAVALSMLLACWLPSHAQVVLGETSKSLCFGLVAARSAIPEALLRAVAKIESNNRRDAIHVDSDGTYDVGIMQVNSSHFEELEADYHVTEKILLERPCVNIAVGARILGGFLRRYGSTWRAVGSYGAGTAATKEKARLQYAGLVARALAKGWHANQVASAIPRERRMMVIE